MSGGGGGGGLWPPYLDDLAPAPNTIKEHFTPILLGLNTVPKAFSSSIYLFIL